MRRYTLLHVILCLCCIGLAAGPGRTSTAGSILCQSRPGNYLVYVYMLRLTGRAASYPWVKAFLGLSFGKYMEPAWAGDSSGLAYLKEGAMNSLCIAEAADWKEREIAKGRIEHISWLPQN